MAIDGVGNNKAITYTVAQTLQQLSHQTTSQLLTAFGAEQPEAEPTEAITEVAAQSNLAHSVAPSLTPLISDASLFSALLKFRTQEQDDRAEANSAKTLAQIPKSTTPTDEELTAKYKNMFPDVGGNFDASA